jgi:hypothetical protein
MTCGPTEDMKHHIFAGFIIGCLCVVEIRGGKLQLQGIVGIKVVKYSFKCNKEDVAAVEILSQKQTGFEILRNPRISSSTGKEFCKSFLEEGSVLITANSASLKKIAIVPLEPADASVPPLAMLRQLPCCELDSKCPGCYKKMQVCVLVLQGFAAGTMVYEFDDHLCFYCEQFSCIIDGNCTNGQVFPLKAVSKFSLSCTLMPKPQNRLPVLLMIFNKLA